MVAMEVRTANHDAMACLGVNVRMKIIRPWQYGHILGSTGGISGSPSPVLVPLGHRGSECPLTTQSCGSRLQATQDRLNDIRREQG
jgi:hypothetical protein